MTLRHVEEVINSQKKNTDISRCHRTWFWRDGGGLIFNPGTPDGEVSNDAEP